ncbi:MAG: hypothetical protein IJS74_00895 [Clostridia bacterium]|nr:hypothetical protein [Clostridia bacterium]
MEETNVKQQFRANLLRLWDIDSFIDLYKNKLDGLESELSNIDFKRHNNQNLKEVVSLSASANALQRVSDIICTKIKNLRDEKKEVIESIYRLAPNGTMDDGHYSKQLKEYMDEIQNTVEEEKYEVTEYVPSEDDLKVFDKVYPGQDIKDLSLKLNVSEEELIRFSKDYVDYIKERYPENLSDEELSK